MKSICTTVWRNVCGCTCTPWRPTRSNRPRHTRQMWRDETCVSRGRPSSVTRSGDGNTYALPGPVARRPRWHQRASRHRTHRVGWMRRHRPFFSVVTSSSGTSSARRMVAASVPAGSSRRATPPMRMPVVISNIGRPDGPTRIIGSARRRTNCSSVVHAWSTSCRTSAGANVNVGSVAAVAPAARSSSLQHCSRSSASKSSSSRRSACTRSSSSDNPPELDPNDADDGYPARKAAVRARRSVAPGTGMYRRVSGWSTRP